MERRTLLFVVLALTIWYSWLLMFPPPVAEDPGTEPTVAETDPVAPVAAPVAPAPPVPAVDVVTDAFVGCGVQGSWTNAGGALSGVSIDAYSAPLQVTPFWSWALGGFGEWKPYGDPPGPAFVLTPDASSFAIGAGELTEAPAMLAPQAASAGGLGGRGTVAGVTVDQTLRAIPSADDPCTFEIVYSWTNPSGSPFDGPLWLSAHDALPAGGGGMMARYQNQAFATGYVDEGVYDLYDYEELDGPTAVDEGDVGWFGISDRYFAALAVPETAHGSLLQTRITRDGRSLDGVHWIARQGLPAGATHTERMKVYIGPKNLELLQAVDPSLRDAVELGWFGFFARPLLWMLKLFHAGVGNWGLAIMLVTFTIKVVFFPLTNSAFRSSQKMASIAPLTAELKEKYPDDPAKVQQETMALWREHGVNPVGGCLPMILQIPVFIALYNVLLSSVELYQTEFLYLDDLSSQDPYGVLPLLVMGLFFLQQRFTPMAPGMDPIQARMMKLMPVVFGIFFFTFPSGLVVYIFVNTSLSVLQQWYIRRSVALTGE